MNDTFEKDAKLNDLLARYAAGQLPLALHVLVASHLALKPQNRDYVHCLESLNGQALEEIAPLPTARRENCLNAIFSSESFKVPQPCSAALMPQPLRQFVGKDLQDVHWRRRLPGLKDCRLDPKGSFEANLYWIKSGHRVPSHTHGGSEITLVLRGTFTDQTGKYAPGDIAIADGDLDHSPIVAAGEDCFCYAVIDAPLRLTGLVGRFMERFSRH